MFFKVFFEPVEELAGVDFVAVDSGGSGDKLACCAFQMLFQIYGCHCGGQKSGATFGCADEQEVDARFLELNADHFVVLEIVEGHFLTSDGVFVFVEKSIEGHDAFNGPLIED